MSNIQNRFLLKEFRVRRNANKKNLDIVFFEDGMNFNSNIYNTVFIGKNASGKSYALEIISNFFIAVVRAINEDKPHNRYNTYTFKELDSNDEFNVLFLIEDKEIEIHILNEQLYFKINNETVPISKKLLQYIPKVLACSFIAHDRFPYFKTVDEKYDYLGIRQAQKSSNRTYTTSIDAIISDAVLEVREESDIKTIYDVLESIGYDRNINFRWDVKLSQSFRKKNKLTGKEISEYTINAQDKSTSIDKKTIEDGNFQEKYREIIRQKEDHDFLSKNDKDIYNVTPNLFIYKNGETFDLKKVSSGEKQILFSLIQIIAKREKYTLVLIDEPESSLHPDLQMKYISFINNLFNNQFSHFIYGTHSHFLVSDLKPEISTILLFEGIKNSYTNRLIKKETFGWSAENILYEVFGLRTSRNYYFEKDMEDFLNAIATDNFDLATSLKDKLSLYKLSGNDPLKEILEASKDDVIDGED